MRATSSYLAVREVRSDSRIVWLGGWRWGKRYFYKGGGEGQASVSTKEWYVAMDMSLSPLPLQ